MACTHPFGIDPIYNDAGEIIGGRCPSCRMVAYQGDSFWTSVRRAWRFLTRGPVERGEGG